MGCWIGFRRAFVRASVLALVIGAGIFVPSSALAASATITSITPNPSGGVSVATNVTVQQSDCSAYGYCGWFLDLTAAPEGQSCTTFNLAQLVGVGTVLDGPGTTPVTLTASLDQPGTYQVCAFADLPDAIGTYTELATATYTPPVATGSITVVPQAGSELGGTISVDQPYCDIGCLWSVNVYEQDGSGSCASTPLGGEISFGPEESALGDETWSYSFTPDVTAGAVQVCAYVENGPLVAASTYTFPSLSTVTSNNNPISTQVENPKLGVPTARAALKRALLKRFRNTRSLTLSCRSLSRLKVRCAARFKHSGYNYSGPVTASLSGNLIKIDWTLTRLRVTTPVVLQPTARRHRLRRRPIQRRPRHPSAAPR